MWPWGETQTKATSTEPAYALIWVVDPVTKRRHMSLVKRAVLSGTEELVDIETLVGKAANSDD